MPVQRTFLGRPVRVQTPPKRFVLIGAFLLFIGGLFVFTSTSRPHIPSLPDFKSFKDFKSIKSGAHRTIDIIQHSNFPKLYNPFGEAVHEPPDQDGNTRKGIKWLYDVDWLNPFSSRISLDEVRAVLPPLAKRAPLYTYYEGAKDKDPAVAEAESELILTWRRAWWAKGFKPIVLGPAEAAKHPLYKESRRLDLNPDFLKELDRWLAWSHMGAGLLCEWLIFPFGWYDPLEPIFSIMRFGRYENITTWQGYGRALVAAHPGNLTEALDAMFEDPDSLSEAKDLFSALRRSDLADAGKTINIGYYDFMTVGHKYKPIWDLILKDEAAGKRALNDLINSHLHKAFEEAYPEGISVITPSTQNMKIMMLKARRLSHLLTTCHETLVPDSCPPQQSHCEPCVTDRRFKIRNSHSFSAATSRFQVGVAPHPYTFNVLRYLREELDTSFIRRKTGRDYFLETTTEALAGDQLSGPQRLPHFKAGVAGQYNHYADLWQNAEDPDIPIRDVEWKVGFSLPATMPTEAEMLAQADLISPGQAVISEEDLQRERDLLRKATAIVNSKERSKEVQREMDRIEAWNMADMEAWRFVKAYGLRREMEREQWEFEERKFAGADKDAKSPGHLLGWLGAGKKDVL